MADKGFGVRKFNLIGASGTPTITSPNNIKKSDIFGFFKHSFKFISEEINNSNKETILNSNYQAQTNAVLYKV